MKKIGRIIQISDLRITE